jgi:methyl-accepting chemotaxis protein
LQDVVLRTASEADAITRYEQTIVEVQRLTGELKSQVTPYLVRLQEVAEATALSRTEIERLAESAEQQLTQVQTLAASAEEVVRLAGTFQDSLGTQLTAIDTLNHGVNEVARISETMDTAADKFCFNRRETDDVSLDDFIVNVA